MFYPDAVGNSFSLQVSVLEFDGSEPTRRYNVCSTSWRHPMHFVVDEPEQAVGGFAYLPLCNQLALHGGYRALRCESDNAPDTRIRFDYVFYRERGENTVRFIFIKFDRNNLEPMVFQIDVTGLQLAQITGMAPERDANGQGYLWVQVEQEFLGETRALMLRVGFKGVALMYDDGVPEAEQWFLHARLQQLSLHTRCALCRAPTALQDDVTKRYYCDRLCQTIHSTTKRLTL